jgi:hypothetical protein
MDERRNNRQQVITVLFLCLLWYIVSSSSNVVGKTLLSDFPYPLTVTMVQLTSITVYSGPFFDLWGVRRYSSNITWSYYLRLIVPLALGKFLANVFSHVSIWKVPVSYAHTGMYGTRTLPTKQRVRSLADACARARARTLVARALVARDRNSHGVKCVKS